MKAIACSWLTETQVFGACAFVFGNKTIASI